MRWLDMRIGRVSRRAAGIVFRDVLFLAVIGLAALLVLVLSHLNPRVENDRTIPPGNLIVEIVWPPELNADVDLWVQAPGGRPVGYSNKGGTVFNLVRDDLGHLNDLSGINFEVAFSRGLPSGEYTINVHLYAADVTLLPIPVEARVSLREARSTRLLLNRTVELCAAGQELTVWRFMIEDRRFVPGSAHDLPRALRSMAALDPITPGARRVPLR